MNFKEALDYVHKLESFPSVGERVFDQTHIDPRKRVNEALSELCSSFLDRGSAKWAPEFRDEGFLYFFASLECLGWAPWRQHARATAKRVMTTLMQLLPFHQSQAVAEEVLRENLEFFGAPPDDWESEIRAMMLELRGWAGMFWRMETHPVEAPANTKVQLLEFCAVQSILMRASVESVALQMGWREGVIPFSAWLKKTPRKHQKRSEEGEKRHSSAIAHINQSSSERREALEAEFKKTLLSAISTKMGVEMAAGKRNRPEMQLFTCIDDRECSLRRHVEATSPTATGIETFGVAGFFGIPIQYHPADGREKMILAPEGQLPKAVLVESGAHENTILSKQRRRFLAYFSLVWESASFSPIGSLMLAMGFPFSIARLFLMGFFPRFKQTAKERFFRAIKPKPVTDFELPFSADTAATLLARTFQDVGMHNRFAPIVMVLGHGAVTANNPFAAAYNCGACGGREGGPNARLLARLANDKGVRAHLLTYHKITLPDDTVFVGGLHNTTADTVEFYDVDLLPRSHWDLFVAAKAKLEHALAQNALERCHRFLLAQHVRTAEEALLHVKTRSVDMAEVRPELNHASNAAVVIGRRTLTKGIFLDRRIFLPSYDPSCDDEIGTNLEHVLAPALIVCSGINLEYLFSTVDVEHHGAGTKAPLNVVGNIGVSQGTAGDLRPGLPTQMTEMHTPIRAVFVVDAPVQRVEAVLRRRTELSQIVRNEWVILFVRDPYSGLFFRQSKGDYHPVDIHEMPSSFVSFKDHHRHGLQVTRREALVYWTAAVGMVLSFTTPWYWFGELTLMNSHGVAIAACGTMLSLPVLAFARRYLHGEFMFARFSLLSVGLLAGFNLVAMAPTMEHAMAGWGLFGFASTFLIGAYNDRSTVRNNATFAFAAYRISDFALLVAATFSDHIFSVIPASPHPADLVAGGLLLAALMKSSQFPLTALFARSMEGPTPASALGYAGLSAHVGVVLLTSTMPMWFPLEWARITLGSVGLFTAAYGTLVSRIRADRKGAIANATSATLGVIFFILSLGYSELALMLSLGHAAFRITQVLRVPNVIADTQRLRSALGFLPWPKMVPNGLYRLSWMLRRIDTDFHLMHFVHRLSSPLHVVKSWKLSKTQQYLLTGVSVIFAGAPFTPFSHFLESVLMDLLLTHPFLAAMIMFGHFAVSVIFIRFLLRYVLNTRRFHKK